MHSRGTHFVQDKNVITVIFFCMWFLVVALSFFGVVKKITGILKQQLFLNIKESHVWHPETLTVKIFIGFLAWSIIVHRLKLLVCINNGQYFFFYKFFEEHLQLVNILSIFLICSKQTNKKCPEELLLLCF